MYIYSTLNILCLFSKLLKAMIVNKINRMEQEVSKVLWNLDDERLKNLEYYLECFEQAILYWKLEEAFALLNQIIMIISGKLSTDEFNECEKRLSVINEIRKTMDNSAKDFEDKRILIYNNQRRLYIYLNKCLVKHGLYFRGGAKSGDSSLMS